MNFLALCQRTRIECGISGSGPTAVTSQSGENLRVVNWTNSAWEDIQNHRPNWKFMRFGFTVNTVLNQDSYAYTACTDTTLSSAIVNFSSWLIETFKIYKTSVADESYLYPESYEYWRNYYRIGTQTASRPLHSTITPDDKIGIGPKPNGVYVLSGDYYRRATTMAANTDTPSLPSEFHMAIVWKAVMYYAQYEEAGALYATAEREYKRILRRLEMNQLPPMILAGPLV